MLNGILLEAARDYTDTAPDVTQTKSFRALILYLRGNLICSVSAAINDEGPAVRDETIAALLNLAFDEVRLFWTCNMKFLRHLLTYYLHTDALYGQAATGNWEAFNYHAKALRLIVKARGGLQALGFHGFLSFLIQRYGSHYKCNLIICIHEICFPESTSSALSTAAPNLFTNQH